MNNKEETTAVHVSRDIQEAKQVVIADIPDQHMYFVMNRSGGGWYAESEPVSAHKYEALRAENERLQRELAQYRHLMQATEQVQRAYEALGRKIKALKETLPDT